MPPVLLSFPEFPSDSPSLTSAPGILLCKSGGKQISGAKTKYGSIDDIYIIWELDRNRTWLL